MRQRQTVVILYLLLVVSILLVDRLWSAAGPATNTAIQPAGMLGDGAEARAAEALIAISDSDPIDAGRASNSVYRFALDGSGMKRLVGSILQGQGYLRSSDIDCNAAAQALVIASHQRDLNGFHHAMLDGSLLHLDSPAAGEPLLGTREIALAPDGVSVIVSREYEQHSPPRFGLVAGDLMSREFRRVKPATAERSYLSPDWSPDGQRISYIVVERAPDGSAIYKLAAAKPDGSDERLIHTSNSPMSALSWSPAGDWLALESGGQIYKIRPDGSGLTRLSGHPAGTRSPRWSPSGARLSYVAPSSFPGFNQLLTMSADGGDIRQVANIHGSLVNGCWVP